MEGRMTLGHTWCLSPKFCGIKNILIGNLFHAGYISRPFFIEFNVHDSHIDIGDRTA